mmetsp:Transcript_28229/g.65275  ORF Transcript_28229/g.65275 Transcript_28229/m.65275 type:complete len:96 (-) Transcript_28229:187-474(-)
MSFEAASKSAATSFIQDVLHLICMLSSMLLGWALLRRFYAKKHITHKHRLRAAAPGGLASEPLTLSDAKSGLHLLEQYGVLGAEPGSWTATLSMP